MRVTVVEKFGNRGMLATERTLRVPFDLDLPEVRVPGVEIQQAIRQRTPDSENQFQRLSGLNRSYDTRQHPDDTSLLARGDQAGRRRRLEHATIARGFPGDNGRDAAIETQDAAMNKRLIGKETGVVNKKFGGEVVDAVNDDIVL